jgi:hypothetical protein
LSSSCGCWQFGGIGGIGLPGGQSAGTPRGRVVVVTGSVVAVVGAGALTGCVVGVFVVGVVVGASATGGRGFEGVTPVSRRWRFAKRCGITTVGAAGTTIAGTAGWATDTNPAERGPAAPMDPPTVTMSYTSFVRVITPAPALVP